MRRPENRRRKLSRLIGHAENRKGFQDNEPSRRRGLISTCRLIQHNLGDEQVEATTPLVPPFTRKLLMSFGQRLARRPGCQITHDRGFEVRLRSRAETLTQTRRGRKPTGSKSRPARGVVEDDAREGRVEGAIDRSSAARSRTIEDACDRQRSGEGCWRDRGVHSRHARQHTSRSCRLDRMARRPRYLALDCGLAPASERRSYLESNQTVRAFVQRQSNASRPPRSRTRGLTSLNRERGSVTQDSRPATTHRRRASVRRSVRSERQRCVLCRSILTLARLTRRRYRHRSIGLSRKRTSRIAVAAAKKSGIEGVVPIHHTFASQPPRTRRP
jgi:hypothetical protein